MNPSQRMTLSVSMRRHRKVIRWCLLFSILLMNSAIGCNQEAELPEEDSQLPQLEEITPDLTINEQPDTFLFGYLRDLTVNARGRMYVGDNNYKHVKYFSPAGEFLGTIGRQGQGPGEFDYLSSVVVGREDTLYTYDNQLRRISAFPPGEDPEIAYVLKIPEYAPYFPGHLQVPASGGFLMAFTQYYSPSDPDPDTMQPYRLITTAGEFQGDLVVHIPGNEALVHSTSNSVTVTSKPFGRKSIVRLGPDDRLYTCWTEDISIEIYTLDGSHIRTVTVSHDPIPVTRTDVQEKLARYDQLPYDEAGSRSGMGQRFKQMLQSADLADTWPALDDMLVATRGQIWLNVQTEAHSGRIWWVVDQSGQILQQYQFPENVDLHEVTGTHAYGIHRDEQGLQRIMRFPVSG